MAQTTDGPLHGAHYITPEQSLVNYGVGSGALALCYQLRFGARHETSDHPYAVQPLSPSRQAKFPRAPPRARPALQNPVTVQVPDR